MDTFHRSDLALLTILLVVQLMIQIYICGDSVPHSPRIEPTISESTSAIQFWLLKWWKSCQAPRPNYGFHIAWIFVGSPVRVAAGLRSLVLWHLDEIQNWAAPPVPNGPVIAVIPISSISLWPHKSTKYWLIEKRHWASLEQEERSVTIRLKAIWYGNVTSEIRAIWSRNK